jgi:hypothetical protein
MLPGCKMQRGGHAACPPAGSGAFEGQKSLLTLRESGQLWIHMGAEPLLQVALPPALPLDHLQLHSFPPAERPDTSTQVKENIVPGNSVSERVRRGDLHGLFVEDLTPIDITHACGNNCLLHFSGGVNVFVTLDLHEHVELVSKCMHALQFIMEPPYYRTLLQGYYRCEICITLPTEVVASNTSKPCIGSLRSWTCVLELSS